MRVLAIDPGYGRCGMAVVEKERGGKETLLYSCCIETSAKTEFSMRLKAVTDACTKLVRDFAPDCLAMEKLYFATNQKTAMRVAEVRGALLSTAANCAMEVFEYTPMQIKSAVAGYGGADKKQIAQILHMLMKIERPVTYDDEYDAIAVGVTHLAIARPAPYGAGHTRY